MEQGAVHIRSQFRGPVKLSSIENAIPVSLGAIAPNILCPNPDLWKVQLKS